MTIGQCILFAFIVMLAACIEGVAGFGGNLLALPFIILFVDIKLAVPILMLVPVVNASLRMLKEYKNIYWPAFWKVTIMGIIGGFFGLTFSEYLSEAVLKLCLSLFMLFIAGKGIYELNKKADIVLCLKTHLSFAQKILYFMILFLSGFYNGAFACGGPFVAIYATNILQEKRYFRATMYSTVLVTMGVLIFKNIAEGVYTGEVLYTSLMLLPALGLGYCISSQLQGRFEGTDFLKLVYEILFIAGCIMLMSAMLKLI